MARTSCASDSRPAAVGPRAGRPLYDVSDEVGWPEGGGELRDPGQLAVNAVATRQRAVSAVDEIYIVVGSEEVGARRGGDEDEDPRTVKGDVQTAPYPATAPSPSLPAGRRRSIRRLCILFVRKVARSSSFFNTGVRSSPVLTAPGVIARLSSPHFDWPP